MGTHVKAFKGRISPFHSKKTEELETVKMPLPPKVLLPMLQQIGPICLPIIKKGEKVFVGQVIGASRKPSSVSVQSSVSGVVTDILSLPYSIGIEVPAVEIEPDGYQNIHESISPFYGLKKEDLINKIKEAGLAGMDTREFLMEPEYPWKINRESDILIINAAHDERFITSDYREILENPQGVLKNIKTLMDLAHFKKAYIGIESSKGKAIERLSEYMDKNDNIEIFGLRIRYPRGFEKQLAYAITRRKIPYGGLPSDVGITILNINSLSNITYFINAGMPQIKKRITVDGPAVKHPQNIEVFIGTQIKDVLTFCGGIKGELGKNIMMGDVSGIEQLSLSHPVVKHTKALLAFPTRNSLYCIENKCIGCCRCVSACPRGLLPLYINDNVKNGRAEENLKYSLNDCMECDWCSYICPASRNLMQSIRDSKAVLGRKITIS